MLKFSFYGLLLASAASLAFITNLTSEPGKIKCLVKDKQTKEPIPFASIILKKDSAGILIDVRVASTNMDGESLMQNLSPGKYLAKAVYVGYAPTQIKNIEVKAGKTSYVNLELSSTSNNLEEIEITSYQIPVIDPDTKTGATVSREDYQNLATRDINSVSGTTQGVYEPEIHSGINVRGGRASYINESNTEEYSKITDNDFKDALKDPLSTFSIDVDKASYSNVRRFISQGKLPPADAVRVEELINYFPYDYPQPANKHPFSISTQYIDCPWNKSRNLIHIGIQGREIKMDKLPSNNLVFLLDVSGSMNQENKLPLLKSGLKLLIEQMRKEDKISIVVYAGAAGIVLPPTSGNQKEKTLATLDRISAGGSTAGGEGIQLAYKLARDNFMKEGNNRIILATDGDFNVGISSEEELVKLIEKERESGVFLTVLGFGNGNYKDSKMEQLADKGNGNYAYIDNLLEAKKVLVKEMGATLLTIAKDVKIQIEFNPVKVKAYRLIGYENRVLNKEDFNDDKKDAGELGAGHNVTAIYEIIPVGSEELFASVDTLIYQKTIPVTKNTGNDVMTIKFRYKEPNGTDSKLITEILEDRKISYIAASEDCRFALSVAEFGMLLRDSKFKGEANYKSVLSIAKNSKGKDEEGYRAEFIRMVEMAELLKN